jgi:hypothetical protein
LVSIGLVLSEEKIFEKVYDVRRTPSDGNSSHDPFLVPNIDQMYKEMKKIVEVGNKHGNRDEFPNLADLFLAHQLLPKTCHFTICSIFSNSGHVGWCTASPDTILKLDTLISKI